ncbi:MAG TPA: hypothetical protein PKV21_03755 [bacterium]|nr:hypothetical protein [bacterium]
MKINNLSVAFFIVFILNLSLGIFVYLKGKRKLSNKIYSIFSLQLAFWSFISFLISSSLNIKTAIKLIKLVFAYASFIPSTFFCLQ